MLVLCNPESIVRSLPPYHPLFFLPFSFFLEIYGSCPLACIKSLLVHSLCCSVWLLESSMCLSWLMISSRGLIAIKFWGEEFSLKSVMLVCFCSCFLIFFFFSFINFGCVVSVGHLHIYNYTICQYVHEVSSVVTPSCCNETLTVIKTFSFSSVIF